LFWLGPNQFGLVQILKISPQKSNLNLTKTIWTVQNCFGPVEGQGISIGNHNLKHIKGIKNPVISHHLI
jgi:hypothetical protein